MQESENSDRWANAMRRMDLEAAWRISDAVLAARDPATRDQAGVPYHRRWVWDGTPLDGRHVLVRCYHGLGDTLQFARFLPALVARAADVMVEAPASLLPLLGGLGARLAAFDPCRPLPAADAAVEIMELSHALRLSPADMRGDWLGGWTGAAGTLGVCCRAGDWNPARTIPRSTLQPVLDEMRRRGCGWVDLESTECSAALTRQTAERVAGCAVVVSVDTFVAHLAGTIGAPTLLLLPHDPDWRWQDGSGRSAWYPSVTMVRQAAPGDWSEPLRAVACRLDAALQRPAMNASTISRASSSVNCSGGLFMK